jgi:D-alanyl-D-alanine carboxypeptidase
VDGSRRKGSPSGHNFASRAGDQERNWDGDLMLRKNLAFSRSLRVGLLGLLAIATAVIFTTESAEARRRHFTRHTHHEDSSDSYRPPFSSIVVDGNTGETLSATSPDASRHPASLTKIMTLYLLFERLDSGRMKLDTEMPVSEHASEQAPTKLGLRPGQTIKVEDAIKGLVTRSANDAAVVVAEAIAGGEEDFAKMMTRKAHALGMSHTTYRNASGLPDDEQVTTARDQSILGRAIQERYPRYYRYFATASFNYHGQAIRNHNHLLGSVDGVDGIKTGYTRASGFNLVTSMHRGNRFLIGVVMGGRSSGSRDAAMRGLLAENLAKGATRRTAVAVTERTSDASRDVAEAEDNSPIALKPQAQADTAPASSETATQSQRPGPSGRLSAIALATAAMPAASPKVEAPAPLTNGVIQTQPIAAIPGSSEPMKPVKVKTVQVKAGLVKLAAASGSQSTTPITGAVPQMRPEVPETSSAVIARVENRPEASKLESARAEAMRPDLPPQPPGHGTGNGILGVLPASSLTQSSPSPQMAYADPASRAQAAAPAISSAPAKPVIAHVGWIVQVGALESEGEAQQRLQAARSSANGLLSKADPFTEPVIGKGERKLFRARFAGLERDQAEAVCRTLRRAEISCITVRN